MARIEVSVVLPVLDEVDSLGVPPHSRCVNAYGQSSTVTVKSIRPFVVM